MTAGNGDLTPLLEFLRDNRGFDFTGYKRNSLQRRIDKRMQEVRIESYAEYLDHLEANAGEFARLFDTILINVTSFFRDPETWTYLQEELVPEMLKQREPGAPIRVWTPGCASGEEAYTIAIVLAEVMGQEPFQERVKIYGTDVDDDALGQGRSAVYTEKDLEPVPRELREKYFEGANGRHAFRKQLRRSVIFGRNDLVADAPISRIDLLLCRNTLMYFNSDTQRAILDRFHFALGEDGYLCLGKSEMLAKAHGAFTAVDLRRRVFQKVPRPNLRERLAAVAQASDAADAGQAADLHVRIRHGAFDQAPIAQIVVDHDGVMVLANQQARGWFDLGPRELGRPLKDLRVAYKPIELLDALETTRADHHVVELGPAEWRTPNSADCKLEARVAPLTSPVGDPIGASISYTDVTSSARLQEQLERSRRELETAYEELQSTVEELETTNEELQSTNEELETTNEELQSTNEELETTNEELQSTNEELETTNEELQSTNEELETINDELSLRSTELEQVTTFMEAILSSLGLTVVVLDREQSVQVWNGGAERMWGLRPEEAEGQHFLGLDIGLPVDKLKRPLRDCLSGKAERNEVTLAAVDRKGRAIDCRVTCVALRDGAAANGDAAGVIMLMDAAERQDGAGVK